MIMDIPVRHNFTVIGALKKIFPSSTPVPETSKNECQQNEGATTSTDSYAEESLHAVNTTPPTQLNASDDEKGSVSSIVSKASSPCKTWNTTEILPPWRTQETSADEVDNHVACLISFLAQEARVRQETKKDIVQLLQNTTKVPSNVKIAETVTRATKASIRGLAEKDLQLAYKEKLVRDGCIELEKISKALNEAIQCSGSLAHILREKKREVVKLSRSLEVMRPGIETDISRTISPADTLVEGEIINDKDVLAFQMLTMRLENTKLGCVTPLLTEKGEVMNKAAKAFNHHPDKMTSDANSDIVDSSPKTTSKLSGQIVGTAAQQEEPAEEAKNGRSCLQWPGMNEQQDQSRLDTMWSASNIERLYSAPNNLLVHNSFQATPIPRVASEAPKSGDAAASHQKPPSDCPIAELPGKSIGACSIPKPPLSDLQRTKLPYLADRDIHQECKVDFSHFPTKAEITLKGLLLMMWVSIGHLMLYKVSLTAVY